jgi:GNAT superfamily N-acetyltransferase
VSVRGEVDGLRLRLATGEDAGLLAAIGAETFRDSFGADNTPEDMAAYLAQSFSPEKQARELAEADNRFLIAEAGGETAGYAQVRFGPGPAVAGGARPMEIARIYARKPWIGRGVGARLMQACLDEAAAAGCDVVWLGVWERNPRAIAFYRRWGFAEAGWQAFMLGSDRQRDVVMVKELRGA